MAAEWTADGKTRKTTQTTPKNKKINKRKQQKVTKVQRHRKGTTKEKKYSSPEERK
jgi:hypothetical protein